LKRHGIPAIDVYWDSVGGNTLETVLDNMNEFGRVVVCGWISSYNTAEKYGIKVRAVILKERP